MNRKQGEQITSAREVLRRRLYDGNPERIAAREQVAHEMSLGMKIRRLREESGMTQKELADRVGTQPSAISRIEDADYDGHSVSFLQRVADALDMLLIIDFEHKPGAPPHRNVKTK